METLKRLVDMKMQYESPATEEKQVFTNMI